MKRLITVIARVALLGALVTLLLGTQGAPARVFALEVTITSGPSGVVDSTDAVFEFSASARGATFSCALDGSGVGPCSSPTRYTGLSEGGHVFQVVARSGGETATARRAWEIRRLGPQPPPPAPSPPPLPPPLPPVLTEADSDRDGVANGRDDCRRTPASAVAIARGCSALDVVTGTQRFLDPLGESVDGARDGLRELVSLRRATRDVDRLLQRGEREIGTGARLLSGGAVCRGAGRAGNGVTTLRRAQGRMGQIVAGLQSSVLSGLLSAGDAVDEDVLWHEFGYRQRLVEESVATGKAVQDVFARVCQAVAGKLAVSGRVLETDDAVSLMRLEGAGLLGIAGLGTRATVYEGSWARVSGVRFDDGTGIASKVVMKPKQALELDGLMYDCVRLRVAPFQSFDPPLYLPDASYVLHDPKGYEWSGVLQLEAGMRFAAAVGKCPVQVGNGLQYYRYSVKLVLKYNENQLATIAADLDAGDDPVALPANIDPNKPTKLTEIERVQICSVVLPDEWTCSAPETLLQQVHLLHVRKLGSHAEAVYDTTGFALEGKGPNAYETAHVKSLKLAGAHLVNATFSAQGYSASGNKAVVEIEKGESFAVYNDDFISEDLDEQAFLPNLDVHGVDHPAALRWPALEGINNGLPFRYLVKLPRIARDLVTTCSPGPDSYYRLPWAKNGVRVVTQGNNTTFTHKGGGKYAFDFGMSDGETILAPRGGVVTFVEESLSENSDPSKNEPAKPANALRIEHQDGTAGWYFHMQKNGVLVAKTDVVERGDPVGIVGNTGNSTGPHLHYQVNQNSIEIRFDVVRAIGAALIPATCWIPQGGEVLMSTNG